MKMNLQLLVVIMLLTSCDAFSYAWNQEKGKIYTQQKATWTKELNTALIDENSPDETFNFNLISRKTLVENYIEYGFKDNTTLIMNLGVDDIHDRLKFNFKNDYHNINDIYNVSYKKADLSFSIIKNIQKDTDSTALIFDIYPGQYYFSKFGDKYIPLKAGISCGAAYGKSFEFRNKNFYYEVYGGSKYFPRIKSVELFLRLKIGYDLDDKWQVSSEASIDIDSRSYTYLPYTNIFKGNINQLKTHNSKLYGKYLDYYKIRINKSTIYNLQLGVSRKISKKREISVNIFADPFKMKQSTGIILSLVQKFK